MARPWSAAWRSKNSVSAHSSPPPTSPFNASRDYRFNAPSAEFGVLYAAMRAEGAFIETFGRVLEAKAPLTTRRQLEMRALSALTFATPLRLVDLTGAGLAGLGIDKRISTTEDSPLAQRWARWFWSHPEAVHGLFYCSRHDPGEACVALFAGRSAPSTSAIANPLSTPGFAAELARLLDRYGAAVL
ncbi:MAG TPA: RES family NAD+ phosphorylase [Polyangiales bacterium]|nr:RES family NAD+ phosphorylase [Polyangiales bacterium]